MQISWLQGSLSSKHQKIHFSSRAQKEKWVDDVFSAVDTPCKSSSSKNDTLENP